MSQVAKQPTRLTRVIALRSFVIWAASVGLGIPIIFLTFYWTILKGNTDLWVSLMDVWQLNRVLLALWPSWILLMVDPNDESIAIPVVSIALNGALYAGLGWLVWFGLYKNRMVLVGTILLILFGCYKLIGLYFGW